MILETANLGTGGPFAKCLCRVVYMFGKVWVKPYCSGKEERY